jgi:hypothetical protein
MGQLVPSYGEEGGEKREAGSLPWGFEQRAKVRDAEVGLSVQVECS